MANAPSSRTRLLDSLRGQTIKVPDLRKYFNAWPGGINPHYKKMIPVVDRKLDRLISDKAKIAKLKQADFALVAASCFPRAAWDEYVILTYLSIWVFILDDVMDKPVTSRSSDFKAAQSFRNEAVSFVKRSLGSGQDAVSSQAQNTIVTSFRAIAEPLRKAYTRDQLGCFQEEMTLSLKLTEVEQEFSMGDKIPTVNEYWACRMTTSGVRPFLALAEYSIRCKLPQSILKSPEMKVIWDETNAIIAIVNDILSLKKEVANGSIIGLIPLTCAQNPDAQAAVDAILKTLDGSIRRFQTAESQLLRRTGQDPKTKEILRSYINVFKENVTGNLHWSLRTPRYDVARDVKKDGSMLINL